MTGPKVRTPRRSFTPSDESDLSLAIRTEDERGAAILTALTEAGGKLMKWQLRERLHEPESLILAALHALRREGRVKVVGRCLDQRAWALTEHVATAVSAPTSNRPRITPKTAPTLTSWWMDAPRDGFTSTAAERAAARAATTPAYERPGRA